MSTMHASTDPVKSAELESDPATWPNWVDEDVWTCTDPGPDPADLEWAAVEFNADDVDEHAALEAAAMDSIERGLIPPDVGNPLRGIGGELAADYADECQRTSGNRPSDEAARQAMDCFWFRLGTGC